MQPVIPSQDHPQDAGLVAYDPRAGYPRFVPCLHYESPENALAWLSEVFGCREVRRTVATDGSATHIELALGSDVVMLGRADSPQATTDSLTFVLVDDADEAVHRALRSGGRVLVPLADEPFGLRQGILADPGGHRWEVSQALRQSTTPIFDQINLIVTDMDAAIDFYLCLGLDLPDAPEWPAGTGARHLHITMPGGARFELDTFEGTRFWDREMSSESSSGRTVVNFAVTSDAEVDRLYDRLIAEGHNGLQPPHIAYWGSRFAVVADPDGHHVGLMGPMNESRASHPIELAVSASQAACERTEPPAVW